MPTAGEKRGPYDGHGGGSLREIKKDGRSTKPATWRLRVVTSGGQIERTYRGNKTDAREALAKLKTEAKPPSQDDSRTFGELLDEWLRLHRSPRGRAWAPKTLHENRREVDQRIRPRLGDVKLDKLTSKDLDNAYRAWQDEGLSDSSVHRASAIISAALRQGMKWKWLESNPAADATPPVQRTVRKLVTPSVDQVSKLIQAADTTDPNMAAAVALAFVTGARRGELAALRWDDVDLEAGVVRIERSLTQIGDKLIEKSTKTERPRVIALDERAVALLRRHKEWQHSLSAQAASPLVRNPYVLSDNANGARPIEPSKLTDRFVTLRGRARIRGVRFHDLRHANITQLIGSGVDVRTVSARAGHASARMTLDRYSHALPAADVAAAAVIGALLPEVEAG